MGIDQVLKKISMVTWIVVAQVVIFVLYYAYAWVSPAAVRGGRIGPLKGFDSRFTVTNTNNKLHSIYHFPAIPVDQLTYHDNKGKIEIINDIPICSDEFDLIRKEKQLYVDKTKIIHDTIVSNKAQKYHFIACPRRFGKSLACSTIKELFSGNANLFQGLYIQDHWNFDDEKRPVIHLNLAELSMQSVEQVENGLACLLQECAKYHNVTLQNLDSLISSFSSLVKALHEKTGKEVVVIIDEYDSPIHSFLSDSVTLAKVTKLLDDFYGVLKPLSKHLRLVYITGILSFSAMSLFSKLNNLIDHTFDIHTNALCGYTREELIQNFALHLEQLRVEENHVSIEETVEVLRTKYNGYCFGYRLHRPLPDRIFNPFEINRNFCSLQLNQEWLNSGNSKVLVDRIMSEFDCRYGFVDTNITDKQLKTTTIVDNIPLVALEYFAGYSTIKAVYDNGEVTLGPPNESIRDHLIEALFGPQFKAPGGLAQDLRRLLKGLLERNEREVSFYLQQCLMKCPHQIWRNLHEKEAKFTMVTSFLIMLATSLERHSWEYIYNETSFLAGGMELAIKSVVQKTVFIFEFKLNQSAKIAIDQIKSSKGVGMIFGKDYTVIAVGINFVKKAKENKVNKKIKGFGTGCTSRSAIQIDNQSSSLKEFQEFSVEVAMEKLELFSC